MDRTYRNLIPLMPLADMFVICHIHFTCQISIIHMLSSLQYNLRFYDIIFNFPVNIIMYIFQITLSAQNLKILNQMDLAQFPPHKFAKVTCRYFWEKLKIIKMRRTPTALYSGRFHRNMKLMSIIMIWNISRWIRGQTDRQTGTCSSVIKRYTCGQRTSRSWTSTYL